MFRGTTKGDFEDHADFDGPLTEQIDGAFHFVKRNLRVRSQLVEENTGRKDTYELPLASVREAICNAAFHRNYLEPSNVYVALYDDRLEIVSPGRLLKEISIEEVRLGYSKIRNKGLADALVYMHVVESWGGGVARYYSAMKEAGLPPPVAEERNGFFTVVFWRPKKDVASGARKEGVNEGVSETASETVNETVSETVNETVKRLIEANPGIGSSGLIKAAGKSRASIMRSVAYLKRIGAIEHRGSDKTGGYYMK